MTRKICDRFELYAKNPVTNSVHGISVKSFLVGKQLRRLANEPVEIIQFAHYMASVVEKDLKVKPEIYAVVS